MKIWQNDFGTYLQHNDPSVILPQKTTHPNIFDVKKSKFSSDKAEPMIIFWVSEQNADVFISLNLMMPRFDRKCHFVFIDRFCLDLFMFLSTETLRSTRSLAEK